MWRLILARAAIRSSSVVPRIQVPLSNFLLNPHQTQSTFLHSPQTSSYLCNNPRFFCHGATLDFQNGVEASVHNDDDDEHRFPEEEEEEELCRIDEAELENIVSLLQSDDDLLESRLDEMGFTLHQDFVIKLLETTTTTTPVVVSVENLVRFCRWVFKERSSNLTTAVIQYLVFAVCTREDLRKKDMYSLWDLVKEIGEKVDHGGRRIINVTSLNQLIISFSILGKGKAALEVLEKFQAFQCVPDADSYFFTIQALHNRSAIDWACSVCRKMLDANCIPDGQKLGIILAWLCKAKKVKEVHAVYKAAVEKGKYPPMSSVSFLVARLSHENDTVPLALEMLRDIRGDRRKHAIQPFSALVRALCRVNDVGAAKKLVLEMIADGPPPGNAVFNFVITRYSKLGEMGEAVEMMKLLESRGLKPDVYTYAVIASGYSNGGEMKEARKILEEAKKNHSVLSPVMFHSLVRGYCKLEQFDEALKLLTEMKDFGVRVNVHEYEKLIQSLCLKAMDWETAEKLQEEMKENGLHLKGITRALIRAVKEMENEVVEA